MTTTTPIPCWWWQCGLEARWMNRPEDGGAAIRAACDGHRWTGQIPLDAGAYWQDKAQLALPIAPPPGDEILSDLYGVDASMDRYLGNAGPLARAAMDEENDWRHWEPTQSLFEALGIETNEK